MTAAWPARYRVLAVLVFSLCAGIVLAQAASGTATCPAPAASAQAEASNATSWNKAANAEDGGPADERPEMLASSPVKDRIKEILAGPDFSPEEVTRVPAFKNKNKNRQLEKRPEWMDALEEFFRGMAEIMRVLVWILVAIGVVALLVGLHYWWRMAAARTPTGNVDLPTRVAGLDIRRESLPDDISAAARAAWQRGDRIQALSFLYRGALSVLVLRCAVAIRSSFTEQECLRAVRRRVGPQGGIASAMADYFGRLTEAWLQSVYARRLLPDEIGLALCDEFDRHFVIATEPAGSGALVGEGA